jgi:hypothetical protein
MRPARLAAGLALLALSLAPVAHAQAPVPSLRPSGVYASIGGAVGVHRTTCPVCDTGGLFGGSGSLLVGAALSPNLVLAGEGTIGWFKERYVEDAYLQAGPTLLYYPAARRLWLKAGVGFTAIIIGSSDGGAVPGAAFSLGAGYDLPLGGALAVSPSITARYSTGQDAQTITLLAGVGVTVP